MCLSSGPAPAFRPAPLDSRQTFSAPIEPACRGHYTPPPTINWANEASKAYYQIPTEPTVMENILASVNKPYEPPIVLGSKLTLSDMDPWNTPVALGSKVTFKSLGFGRSST